MSPLDDSYARHGPECVKKQEQLAKIYLATKLREETQTDTGDVQDVIDDADSLEGEKQENLPVAQGVPGIPEAPVVFAKEQENEKTEKTEKGVAKDLVNAVDVGDDGRPKDKKDGLHVAVLVEEGEEARLACHYCHGPDNEGWFLLEQFVFTPIGFGFLGVYFFFFFSLYL